MSPSHIAVELGFVSSILSSGGALSEFIDDTPLSFVDDLLPIINASPLHSLKPLDMLPGWWYWASTPDIYYSYLA